MKEDLDKFRKIVKETRISYLSAKPETTCETEEKTMISDQHIEDNVNSLIQYASFRMGHQFLPFFYVKSSSNLKPNDSFQICSS